MVKMQNGGQNQLTPLPHCNILYHFLPRVSKNLECWKRKNLECWKSEYRALKRAENGQMWIVDLSKADETANLLSSWERLF